MCVHSLSPGWQLHKSSPPPDMFKDRWGAPSQQNISCPRTITQHVPRVAAVKYKQALAHGVPQHPEKSRSPPHVSSSAPFCAECVTQRISHFPASFTLTLLPCSTSFLWFAARRLLLHSLGTWASLNCKCHLFKFQSHSKGLQDPLFWTLQSWNYHWHNLLNYRIIISQIISLKICLDFHILEDCCTFP